MRQMLVRWLRSQAPAATLLVRAPVALVFLSEGIQKFLFPAALGAGRFAKIGLPSPELLAPFVGVVEIAGGLLVALGLLTRFAAAALVIDMIVAFASTKIPMLSRSGFWAMAHEARTDVSMLLCSVFILVAGGGPRKRRAARGPAPPISLDARIEPAPPPAR
jgi:putative oxidoreductase